VGALTDFLLERVAPAAGSGVVGVAVAIWRLQKGIGDRVLALETAWWQFSEKDYARERLEVLDTVKGLRADVSRELEDLEKELRQRARERVDARRLQTRLSERYMSLEGRVEVCEKAIADLNDQFQSFAREQNEQWQTMTRTLGQLEGYLRGISRRVADSGKFPERS